jgi:DNA-binding FadR family transcriptional regulator
VAKVQRLFVTDQLKLLRPRTLDAAVLDALAAYVDHAKIAPGSKLPSERVLSEELGASRPTVREALKRWEALGIIELRKGSRAYLKVAVSPKLAHVPLVLGQPSKVKDLIKALAVRRALEGEAAAIAEKSASAEAITAIKAALLKLGASIDSVEREILEAYPDGA